jgi:hypothetical protein
MDRDDDPESLAVQILDVSINRLCWILTCPFFHGGCFCPYQTGTYRLVLWWCFSIPLMVETKQQTTHGRSKYPCLPKNKTRQHNNNTVLYLRRHDVERHDRSVCGGRRSTRPYDQLGRILVSDCFCLVCVDSELGTILPGNGCDRDTCNIIAQTLRDRQQQGDGAAATSRWVNRQMVDRTEALERKIDVILDHIGSRNNNREQQQQQHLPATGVVVHIGPSPPPPPAFSMSMSDR